jgi:hypothetical protein
MTTIYEETFKIAVEFTADEEADLKALRKEFKRRLMAAFIAGFDDPHKPGNISIGAVRK